MSYEMKTIPGCFNEKPGIQVGTKLEGEVRMDENGEIRFDEDGVQHRGKIDETGF